MNTRHTLLVRLLSKEENRSCDELMKQSSESMTVTRATSRGVPPPQSYYNSFLPKTVREFKSKLSIQ
ncbi:hypothetical protein EB796_007780 [Bugula neritina]|uniref:Uncharacterized protein n=1 Tax=Bugula neritina TaxID=10212 RepID=A0A7J7K5K7_BUGNE|nr:hypothetical protein EB796_007780 [Bugula neritina]